MRRHDLRAALVALIAVVLAAAPPLLPAQGESARRTVFVSAVDGKGVPVSGLTAADCVIREDGRDRPVVAAVPATAPLTVVLLIDDSGLGLQSIREGAAAFITRLQGLASIALVTTGGRNIMAVDFTDSTAALMAGINRTYARNVTGAFLTDGIVEAAEAIGRREALRSAIVSVGNEDEDFSDARPSEVLDALQRTRTKLYMVRLGRPVIGQSNALGAQRGESLLDEQMRFNAILGQAPPRSGGRIETLAAHSGIPRMMESFAAELAGEYEVTFETPNPAGVDLRLEVSTPRRGIRVRAAQRVGPPRD